MTCTRCRYEDTDECIDCQEPDRDEIVKKLQGVLKSEREKIEEAKPIDRK